MQEKEKIYQIQSKTRAKFCQFERNDDKTKHAVNVMIVIVTGETEAKTVQTEQENDDKILSTVAVIWAGVLRQRDSSCVPQDGGDEIFTNDDDVCVCV